MKFRTYFLAASLAVLSMTSTASFALFNGTGAYVEANAGTNFINVNNIFIPGSTSTSGGFAWNINLGYLLYRYFAIEAGFTQNTAKGLRPLNAAHLVAKGVLPLGQRFNVFLKLGAAYVFVKGKNVILPYGGVGAAFAISPRFAVNAQFNGWTDALVSVGALTGGLTYYFSS